MNVILLESVDNLGSIGDLVKVKPGYARNYLLPQGKAALATPANMKEIEKRRAELERVAAEELAKAKERAKAFDNLEVVISANAGSEGKLGRPDSGGRRVPDRGPPAYRCGRRSPGQGRRRRINASITTNGRLQHLVGCDTFEAGNSFSRELVEWSEHWTMAALTEVPSSASRCRRTP
jgi:hypothetical protein